MISISNNIIDLPYYNIFFSEVIAISSKQQNRLKIKSIN